MDLNQDFPIKSETLNLRVLFSLLKGFMRERGGLNIRQGRKNIFYLHKVKIIKVKLKLYLL